MVSAIQSLWANPDRGRSDNSGPPAQQGQVNRYNAQAVKKAKQDDPEKHSEEYSE